MRLSTLGPMAFLLLLVAVASVSSCGGSHDGNGDNGSNGSAQNFMIPGSSGAGGGDGGGVVCPADLQCNYQCSGSATTSITGKVYDPAGRDPLYNITVYVPATPLLPLPKGVPTGAAACSCPALFPSGQVVTTTTGVDGTFTLSDAPVGDNVPLVIQVGKWRRQFNIKVTACQENAQPDKTLTLPSTIAAGDTTTNMPDIAVSTGEADTLECLMRRIGLPTTEYVAGAGGTGHVHVFAGGKQGQGGGGAFGCLLNGAGGGGGVGTAECPGMTGAPASYESLWDSQNDLMPYDIVLLSCEGGETYNANPPALESYLNVGGRVFASHYHYAWFAGPIGTGQNYKAPADWGTALATWTKDGTTGPGTNGMTPIGGDIVTTLNGTTTPFPKGQALNTWLGDVGALGQNGVPATELAIYQPRYDAQVVAANKPSQPWITYSESSSELWTMYFSFDTPINPSNATTTETAPQYCGRAVYSDLHVAGNPATTDTMSPPAGCEDGDLSPQEKALEFMLFDLSSCVIPDSETPPSNGIIPQ
jgi:hypothetical protein